MIDLPRNAYLSITQVCFCLSLHWFDYSIRLRPEFFLLVDLWDFFTDLGSGGRKKKKL